MRSRLYLNLGLVYETQGNLERAQQFMEKALSVVKYDAPSFLFVFLHPPSLPPSRELGDSETIFQCHFDLGSLHLRKGQPTHALHSFQEALSLAVELKNAIFEADCHRELAQVGGRASLIPGSGVRHCSTLFFAAGVPAEE